MNPLMAPTASICPGDVGRITAQSGRFGLMNSHGTGKIRFVWRSSFGGTLKFGNVNPLIGSLGGAIGGCTPLLAKSTHSGKWQISSPPMPSVMSRTWALDTFRLSVAYRLVPGGSRRPKWKAAVLAVVWMWAAGPESELVLGIAGN